MKRVIISEFKAKCIAVIKEAQRTGEPVLVTRRGLPVARIEPILEAPKRRQLGVLRGRMKITGDIVKTEWADDWEMLL